MSVITTGKPAYYDINSSYSINLPNYKELYNGEIYQYGASETNITPIIQQYVNAPDYDSNFWNGATIIQDIRPYIDTYYDDDINEYEIKLSGNYDDNILLNGTGFNNSDVRSIRFGENITEIGNICQNCQYLGTIYLGSNVTYISPNAFRNSPNLYTLILLGSTPPTEPILPTSTRIVVDSYYIDDYKAAWPTLSNRIMSTDSTEFASYIMGYNSIIYDAPNIINAKFNNINTYSNKLYNYLYDHRYVLSSPSAIDHINAFWNYTSDINYDNIPKYISYGVQDYVYPSQYVVESVVGVSPLVFDSATFNLKVNDTRISSLNLPIMIYSNSCCIKLDDKLNFNNINQGDNVKIEIIHGVSGKRNIYNVKMCIPDGTVTLYYINMLGGISWCHFNKKNTSNLSVTRKQTTHNNLDNSSQFGIDNYMNSTFYEYTLNTDWLNDDEMHKLQDLFKSPKVWMWDYNEMKSVVLTENSYAIKNKHNDKLYNYTVKVKDSQTQYIYS